MFRVFFPSRSLFALTRLYGKDDRGAERNAYTLFKHVSRGSALQAFGYEYRTETTDRCTGPGTSISMGNAGGSRLSESATGSGSKDHLPIEGNVLYLYADANYALTPVQEILCRAALTKTLIDSGYRVSGSIYCASRLITDAATRWECSL